MSPPMKFKDAIASRLKIMARLDIAERRLPQDGRIKLRFVEHGIEGNRLPRLLLAHAVRRKDRAAAARPRHVDVEMANPGFEPAALARFESAIARPWGMVLVTGPTGSGKTNTLYSAISRINTGAVNIMTAEDPVEFNLPGVNQLQVRENDRAHLRRRPPIVSPPGPERHPGRRNSGMWRPRRSR